MDEHHPRATTRRSLFQRRATRRAVLAGTASLAAAGSAAAVVGFGNLGSDPEGEVQASTAEPTSARTATASTATATVIPAAGALTGRLREAAHLLRRAGFGGTPEEIEAFAAMDREEAVSRLVDFETIDNSALEALLERGGFVLTPSEERQAVAGDMQRWWLTRMAHTARPLEERMTLIWHGLLTSQVSKVGPQRAHWLLWQNELFREHALGRYDDLVQVVAKDPAMMTYLDTVESTAEHPNENFPRELMELFTMGEGNYSEDDVRESSRAFTGWRLTEPPRPPRAQLESLTEEERRALVRQTAYGFRPEFRFDQRQHDGGEKTFLGQTGAWGGEDVIAIIMGQEATGTYITTRLWEEFAYPEPEPEVVDALVGTWQATDHDVREVVRAILLHDEFYSERAYRAKVRSPVELIAGLWRGLKLDPGAAGTRRRDQRTATGYYQGMDQVLFEPPNVAGWPGGSAWLSSATFFARLNYLDELLFPGGVPLPIAALQQTEPEALVDAVTLRLVDGNLPASARDAIAEHVGTLTDPAERAATAAYLVAGSPEFQLI
jgi:uncharacterized protein (DUF1800 family)